jgi:hypothetical protein
MVMGRLKFARSDGEEMQVHARLSGRTIYFCGRDFVPDSGRFLRWDDSPLRQEGGTSMVALKILINSPKNRQQALKKPFVVTSIIKDSFTKGVGSGNRRKALDVQRERCVQGEKTR